MEQGTYGFWYISRERTELEFSWEKDGDGKTEAVGIKREYSDKCGFVRARMSLAKVRSNILLLCVPNDKGARIRQRPELTDGAVMALLTP